MYDEGFLSLPLCMLPELFGLISLVGVVAALVMRSDNTVDLSAFLPPPLLCLESVEQVTCTLRLANFHSVTRSPL